MGFEYDPDKSIENKRKHGIDFEEARMLWADPELVEIPARTTDELRWLIMRCGALLQATALVNDVYIRLVDQKCVNWQNRAHFFGAAAQMIRRLLVDHARARHRLKRGGNVLRVTLHDDFNAAVPVQLDVVALDDALSKLAHLDPQQERIVELRFFTGLSIEETAEALSISPATRQTRLGYRTSVMRMVR